MRPGDILRQRRIRTYGASDCRNYAEFIPDQEKRREFQMVFVSMLLGVEMFKLNAKPGGEFHTQPLDELKALNALGFWNEAQLEAVLGKKELKALLKKLKPFMGRSEKIRGAKSDMPK